MFRKKVELYDAIRWDGENLEIIQSMMGFPCKKAGFGGLTIETGEKSKVTIKKGEFAVKSLITDEITSMGLDEFEKRFEGAR